MPVMSTFTVIAHLNISFNRVSIVKRSSAHEIISIC